mmetsp:Transcript_76001/g.114447  ORF Transcript_76001/g.114447 Transcript_76001/m.114447 type:complete len:259 (+) Transcript_76001:237-1013(+)|eukprot:CAMPEP_0116999340 /NCGR_PEP_ID=MMETSP0472-20121206/2080_1 /TAXON_ID=693140 ORGANISM="Tiarina fusus, Strain LIS" /NCGR_SAMPLE_ID=MMETSP0472 /ASSEMBLY_ACC=CAM_ASM_000603 /LENGTH=258 /DNA_ID=CAMNT_0004698731 /DNA_START=227 /DNA_END=1003 /DNA_ORIENTATION=+
MTTLAFPPLLRPTNSLVKALDIETCRNGVQKAATAKAASGRGISIRQCLLDAGFCEGQASNRTMQMRVYRQVQKLQKGATAPVRRRQPKEATVPSEVCFNPFDDDLVSVLTDGSGGFRRQQVPRSATPAETAGLPTSIYVPPPQPVSVSVASSPLRLLPPEHHHRQQPHHHRLNHEALRSSPNLFASVGAQSLHGTTLDPPIIPLSNGLAGLAGASLYSAKRSIDWASYPVPPAKRSRPQEDHNRVVLSLPPFTATCR